jgi:DNA-binding transcriptional MerR regulator
MQARYNVLTLTLTEGTQREILSDSATCHFYPAFMATTYTIAELAREFDITARAIRFYEDQGLLSPSREGVGGRNRVYTPRDRTRLKLTLRGKRLGLTLSEIKSIVDMYESPRDTSAQINRFLGVLAHQRETLEQQRADIEMALEEISAHEEECRRLLAEGQPEASGKAISDAA